MHDWAELGASHNGRGPHAYFPGVTVQLMEPLSRLFLGWHLRRKAQEAAATGDCDVLIEPQRLKLHLRSHKKKVLEETDVL